MDSKMNYFKVALEKKYQQKHYQQLRCVLSKVQHDTLNFNTLDFLGLTTHPYVKNRTIDAIARWGAGSCSSRVLIDHLSAHVALEKKLAALLGTEAVMLFPSAFAAQTALFGSLAAAGSTFYAERSYPTQLVKGHLNARSTLHTFDRKALSTLPDGREPKIVITSSICSKTGEVIDLRSFMSHAVESDALLMVDDSYALGMLGKRGFGLATMRKGVDLIMGAFGIGSFGAYLGCSQLIKNYLSTFTPFEPLPPANIGAIEAALELIPDMDAERLKVLDLAKELRKKFILKGHSVIDAKSHIVGLKTDPALYKQLADHGIIAMPTDLPGIAFNLTIKHTPEHIDQLVKQLGQTAPALV
ncbi:MAG TPA: aminotransferase class I/II-fold pyridoxal phosphate-dependent enzyme [Chlamydiales bacterium]|nr:aminotransferase class I/II-fold pyridoxal phosphate-dependent enzyme [Chlamydiales bacterium]